MATAYADGNFHTRNIRAFIEDVEKSTNGALSIQLHSNATLLTMPNIKRRRAVRPGANGRSAALRPWQ